MNLRTLAIALIFFVLAVFALLNWSAFSTPSTLSLGFAQVQAPLGLIMLIVTGLVSGLFLVYIVFQQAGVIFESRRYEKELRAHRELADKAEASRIIELKDYVSAELHKFQVQISSESGQLGARMQHLEQRALDKLDESTRTLSAYVGEVDDKLDRALKTREP